MAPFPDHLYGEGIFFIGEKHHSPAGFDTLHNEIGAHLENLIHIKHGMDDVPQPDENRLCLQGSADTFGILEQLFNLFRKVHQVIFEEDESRAVLVGATKADGYGTDPGFNPLKGIEKQF